MVMMIIMMMVITNDDEGDYLDKRITRMVRIMIITIHSIPKAHYL